MAVRKTAAPQKKRGACSNHQNAPPGSDVEREFLKTMNSMQKFTAESETELNSKVHEDNDGKRDYCFSLVGQLKARFKVMAKMQIMKVFNDIEWMKESQSEQLPFPSGSYARYPHVLQQAHIQNNLQHYQHQMYKPPDGGEPFTVGLSHQAEQRAGYMNELMTECNILVQRPNAFTEHKAFFLNHQTRSRGLMPLTDHCATVDAYTTTSPFKK